MDDVQIELRVKADVWWLLSKLKLFKNLQKLNNICDSAIKQAYLIFYYLKLYICLFNLSFISYLASEFTFQSSHTQEALSVVEMNPF